MLLYEVLPKYKCEYVCALILVVVLFFVCVCGLVMVQRHHVWIICEFAQLSVFLCECEFYKQMDLLMNTTHL